eukprot:868081-Pyramimonas_sp.AAC.1
MVFDVKSSSRLFYSSAALLGTRYVRLFGRRCDCSGKGLAVRTPCHTAHENTLFSGLARRQKV